MCQESEESSMSSNRFKPVIMLLCVLFVTAPAMAQSPRAEVFKDDLLDNLVGEWKLVRKMQSRITQNVVKAEWVLNHQFFQNSHAGCGEPTGI